MAGVTVVPVRTLAEYLRRAETLYDKWQLGPGCVWFRGLSKSSYRLLPGRMRPGAGADEDSPALDFMASYESIYDSRVSDGWELYGLMQHHGMATRLLDWTKSALVALYFAVEKRGVGRQKRLVWAIDPYALNEALHGVDAVFMAQERYLSQAGIAINDYLPGAFHPGRPPRLPKRPIAIEPPLTNKRVLAQQGCFTVHGSERRSIDAYITGPIRKRKVLFAIEGERLRTEVLDSLQLVGITDDAIYQDLDALSRRIRAHRLGG